MVARCKDVGIEHVRSCFMHALCNWSSIHHYSLFALVSGFVVHYNVREATLMQSGLNQTETRRAQKPIRVDTCNPGVAPTGITPPPEKKNLHKEKNLHIDGHVSNSNDGLCRTTQTLVHVVVVHILTGHPRKSKINEYNGISVMFYFMNDENLTWWVSELVKYINLRWLVHYGIGMTWGWLGNRVGLLNPGRASTHGQGIK